jgi:ABC-type dipeptide/oligopeptide/nickel transport system permease component
VILRYILRRFVLLVPVVLGVTLIVFAVVRFAPGDPLKLKMGEYYRDEDVAALRHAHNLDQAVPVQYLLWLSQAVRGDMGTSIFTNEPVLIMIWERAGTTLFLSVSSTIVALLVAIPAGVLSALRKDSWFDNLTRLISILGLSMPVFWLGLLLIIAFAVVLPIFPPGGSVAEFGPRALVLPCVALAFGLAALIARMTRSYMLEVLGQEFVSTARAKGLSESAINYRHALKNALLPIVTIVGFQFGTTLGGAVLTETIFNLSGLGRLLVDSVTRRDYPVIQAGALLIALIFVLTNLAVDVLYAVIDPRVQYE